MVIKYNIFLVFFSAIIAIGAGYLTIEMAIETTKNQGFERLVWLGISSITMGMGIWGMHFIAMTAFSMSIEISYNFFIVLLSLLAATLGCAQGLFIITKQFVTYKTLIAGSIMMGLAIAGMHYIGMKAMVLEAKISYQPFLLILSVIIAIVVSFVAIKIVISLRVPEQSKVYLWKKIAASLLMGGAVLSMHYTGMAAARFQLDSNITMYKKNILDNDILGLSIGLAVIGIFIMVYLVLWNANLSRSN